MYESLGKIYMIIKLTKKFFPNKETGLKAKYYMEFFKLNNTKIVSFRIPLFVYEFVLSLKGVEERDEVPN